MARARLRRAVATTALVFAPVMLLAARVPALASDTAPGRIHGKATTQEGSVLLPGVLVTLSDQQSGKAVGEATSDDKGRFSFPDIAPGVYRLKAFLSGFIPRETGPVTVVPGQDIEVALDLLLEGISESVDVSGSVKTEAAETATTKEVLSGSLTDLAPLAGDTFQAMLPVLPGVVRASDGRINVKGGRSNESALQVGGAVVTDPVTGEWGFALPPEAVVSVDLQPNPYTAEFGRFASGVATIETRSGSNEWRFAVNGFVPVPRVRRNRVKGIGSFGPRLSISGAPLRDRLYLHQSLRYQFLKTRVPSQPEPNDDILLREFESFTRADWVPQAGHTVTASVATVAPWRMDYVTLNTFNPREVTPTVRQQGFTLALSERSVLGANALFETSYALRSYRSEVSGQGSAPMRIGVSENRGNFFNEQRRDTVTSQISAALTIAGSGGPGEHLMKFGADVLHSSFKGRSSSREVVVTRTDGSISRLIAFSPESKQLLSSADVALYAQDKWRTNDRLLVEFGARADRDGVLQRWDFAPRAGTSISLVPSGASVLRGGAGVFVGRTPMNVGVFESYERPSVTHFPAGNESAGGTTVHYDYRSDDSLRTPWGVIWNVELDQRVTQRLSLRVNHLRRSGRNEYILDVVPAAESSGPVLALRSRGRSRYRETEVTVQYRPRTGFELDVSYVRSRSESDLNGFDGYFGNIRNPLIHPNEYGLTAVDVPNRVLLRGELPIGPKWSVAPLVELRSGFPYSAVDEDQHFVGPRNAVGRMPNLYTVDLGINRLIVFRKRNTWVGLRFYHLLNTFSPRDVRTNVAAPDFGAFFNTIPRKVGFNFYIQP
ncbi:MAG: carboxypeptidase regulatory-like domain-containing protein [Vicinamibacterales bacterium]